MLRAVYTPSEVWACSSGAGCCSKGQITIPVSVRSDLQVDMGDRVEFVPIAPGWYEFIAVTREVTELKGMFGKASKAISVETMNAAIAAKVMQTR